MRFKGQRGRISLHISRRAQLGPLMRFLGFLDPPTKNRGQNLPLAIWELAIFGVIFGSFFNVSPRYKMGIHWPGGWHPWLKTCCLGSIRSVLNIGYPTQGDTGAYVGSHIWGFYHSEYRVQKGWKGRFRQNEPKMFIDDPCWLWLSMWEDNSHIQPWNTHLYRFLAKTTLWPLLGPVFAMVRTSYVRPHVGTCTPLSGVTYVQNTSYGSQTTSFEPWMPPSGSMDTHFVPRRHIVKRPKNDPKNSQFSYGKWQIYRAWG